jgi:hypothetical protein
MTAAVVITGVGGVGVEDTTVVTVQFPSLQRLMGSVCRLWFIGHCVDTTNVGSRAPGVPLLYGPAREGPIATITAGAPDQGADGVLSIHERSHS